jgi:hypothetical protein
MAFATAAWLRSTGWRAWRPSMLSGRRRANMIAAKVNFAGQVRPSIDSIELPDGRTLTAFHSSYY